MKKMILMFLMLVSIQVFAINYPTYTPSVRGDVVSPVNATRATELYRAEDIHPTVPAVSYSGVSRRRFAPVGWVDSNDDGYDDNTGLDEEGNPKDDNGDGINDITKQPIGSTEGTAGDHSGTPSDTVDDGRLPIGSIMILLIFALMHVAFIAYTTSARRKE